MPLVIDLTIDSDDEHVRIMPPKTEVRSQAMPVALKTSAELPLTKNNVADQEEAKSAYVNAPSSLGCSAVLSSST